MDAKRGLGPGEEPHSGGIAEARPSASIIVLRDSDEGPEVLLVERNHEQRFMGGAWVFPGGATHDEDDGELATAVRELEEEAGISLAADAEPVRFSRWITPAQVKMRFDTHFFVVRAPDGAEPKADGTECVDVCWIRPQEALDAGERGELKLVFPTIKHLEELATYGSVEEALAAARDAPGDAGSAAGAHAGRRGSGADARRAGLRRLSLRRAAPATAGLRSTLRANEPLGPDRSGDGARLRLHLDGRLPSQAPWSGGVRARRVAATGALLARALQVALVRARDPRGARILGLPRRRARRWPRSRWCSR